MRVAEAVLVRRRVGAQPRRLRLEQRDTAREVEVARPARCRRRVAQRRQRAPQPGLVVEADAHEQGGGFESRELAGLHLDGVRILQRRRQALDGHAVAADGLHQRPEIGRRRDDGERDGESAPAGHRYFLAKIDFGIMQCTPLRTSTTWVTRQSPTIETSEYAS